MSDMCQQEQSDGTACTRNNECQSGNCVDGFCCDSVCDGECEACSEALTGADDGSCSAVAADSDPDGDCGFGLCDAAGACTGSPCRRTR